jgi:hypothetical protein
MEIYAICNWTISPFNGELNRGVDEEDRKDYAFLTIPKDSATRLLTTTDIESYIVCSCPIDAIQAIFPQKMLEVKTEEEQPYEMLFSKIVINNGAILKVVVTNKVGEGKYEFVEGKNARPGELASGDGIVEWVRRTTTNLMDVNVTVSRDPPSCPDKDKS